MAASRLVGRGLRGDWPTLAMMAAPFGQMAAGGQSSREGNSQGLEVSLPCGVMRAPCPGRSKPTMPQSTGGRGSRSEW